MSSELGKIIADFRTSLAVKMAVGATTGTLQSATDDDGVALPAGTYYFTIDGDNSQKEHIKCSLSGTALTSVYSVSRQGVKTSGAAREHRIGASVVITNFAHIKEIADLIGGNTDLNASDPLKYDGVATLTPGSNQLATVAYADSISLGGAPDMTLTSKGIGEKATDAQLQASAADGSGDTSAPLVATSTSFNQTPTANKVPVGKSNAKLDDGWLGLTTAGDMPYSDGTDFQRLAIGTARQVLRTNQGATAPQWEDDGVLRSVTAGETINGATLPVAVFFDNAAGEWLACDANVLTRLRCDGFAITNGTDGNAMDVKMTGIVTGFSGLTAGREYFVQDDKTLGLVQGTFRVKAGVAISSTSLLIQTDNPSTLRRATMGDGRLFLCHGKDWTGVEGSGTVTDTRKAITLAPSSGSSDDDGTVAGDGRERGDTSTVSNMSFDLGCELQAVMVAGAPTGNQHIGTFIGFAPSTALTNTQTQVITAAHIGFFWIRSAGGGSTWTLYTSNADGTTQTTNTIGGYADPTVEREYRFEYDLVSIRFYIDGTLVATHTTNLPTGTMGVNLHGVYVWSDSNGGTARHGDTTVTKQKSYFVASFV